MSSSASAQAGVSSHSALELSARQPDTAVSVYVHLVFLRVGEIDTLNERYQAHASIESHWYVPYDQFKFDLSADDHTHLFNGKLVVLDKYAQSNWHPQLYIENALGDIKEQVKYSAKMKRGDNQVCICEYHTIKGLFWEKLELHHFPSDVQDLSISVTSMLPKDKVLLIADPHRLSGVNLEAFIDQQEWSLYEHVDTEQRFVKDFAFRTGDDTGSEDSQGASQDKRQRSIITVTCHAARQSDYFYWNGYFLIFIITSVSFCAFGMPMQVSINRLQVSCTLLLTSVTFRWTVNRSLPTVSYLTTLDRYGLLCMIGLVVQSFWHGLISVITWSSTSNYTAPNNSWIKAVDHVAFGIAVACFVVFHIGFIIWLYRVPLKHRKQMKQKDEEYRALVAEGTRKQDMQVVSEVYTKSPAGAARI